MLLACIAPRLTVGVLIKAAPLLPSPGESPTDWWVGAQCNRCATTSLALRQDISTWVSTGPDAARRRAGIQLSHQVAPSMAHTWSWCSTAAAGHRTAAAAAAKVLKAGLPLESSWLCRWGRASSRSLPGPQRPSPAQHSTAHRERSTAHVRTAQAPCAQQQQTGTAQIERRTIAWLRQDYLHQPSAADGCTPQRHHQGRDRPPLPQGSALDQHSTSSSQLTCSQPPA